MSLKIKIVLFISILVILSLGATLIFLSFYEYKPALKNEIIQRIDYQLDHITSQIFRAMIGDIKYHTPIVSIRLFLICVTLL